MVKAFAHPFICASSQCSCEQLLDNLQTMMEYPDLSHDEKTLWVWLANRSAKTVPHTCSFSYEHISILMNKPHQHVHRSLFRLKIMGFLIADLPIWYGDPTPQMCKEIRVLKPVAPTKTFLANLKALHQIKFAKGATYVGPSTSKPFFRELLKKEIPNVKTIR